MVTIVCPVDGCRAPNTWPEFDLKEVVGATFDCRGCGTDSRILENGKAETMVFFMQQCMAAYYGDNRTHSWGRVEV